ncbi:Wzz/FepE/Etk N-terminal domain-containing protein [Virgibacillus sp. C22-A2]|uniref:Wzz/FepE/Etk N-terminal domain-containing protein n=1 Tax=Virgibacillus tibetensis TaxID=3042313 RepID=A0ABU6KFC8_9BACI|nr:Wzz/FepE/Etk N-terminal domain-containing protein [Virgibacillus sp. C22-A2]
MKEINLKEIFASIKQRFWIIALVAAAAALAGFVYSNLTSQTLLYESSTRVIIGSDSESMSTLMVMIKDPIVMNKVKEELQLSRPSESLSSQIEVQRLEDSQVIMISVIDTDPVVAASIANATANAFKNEIVNILDFRDVQLLSAAQENPYPINEKQNHTTVIALVFGIITGTGLVFLLESLDGKIRKERDVEEALGVPVIGVVSNMNKKKLVMKKTKSHEVKLRRSETVGVK